MNKNKPTAIPQLLTFPLRVITWHVLIEPLSPPEETQGGIVIAPSSKEAEQIMITVGKVLQMGSLAFTGKTESGISMADERDAPEPGDYVLFQRYTGQKTMMRNGRLFLILQDSEIIAKVTEPEALRFHI